MTCMLLRRGPIAARSLRWLLTLLARPNSGVACMQVYAPTSIPTRGMQARLRILMANGWRLHLSGDWPVDAPMRVKGSGGIF